MLDEDTTPSTPELVYPAMNATVNGESVTLDWSCDDEDGDALTYTVYLGFSSTPGEYESGVTGTRLPVTNLEEESTYYWSVSVEDEDDNFVEGPVWVFNTEGPDNHAPNDPYSPSPAHNQIDVSLETIFSWQCEDSDGDQLRYKIEIDEGADGSIEFKADSLTLTSYIPPTPLLYGTDYSWTITAYDPTDASSSSTWNFSTVSYQAAQLVSVVGNMGLYGDPNNSITGNQSGEWPANSGMNYIWEGRLWIGAVVNDGADTLVSHTDYGDYEWYPSPQVEGGVRPPVGFTLLGDGVWQMTSTYDDRDATIADHTPLGLRVEETVTAFPVDGAMGSMFLVEQTITPTGENALLDDLYITYVFDGDIASGPNQPTHANGGALDDLVGYDPTYQIGYLYDGDDPNTAEDDTGENGTTLGYLGIALIESGQPIAAAQWWNWEEDSETDEQKYMFMAGTHPVSDGPFRSAPDEVFDYRVTISSGPYRIYDGTGDSIHIAWTFGVGEGLDGLQASVAAMRDWYAANR